MKRGIHLVWALPLGLVLAYFALVFSTWEWCGIRGCSTGAGRIASPNFVAALLWLLGAGVMAALPLGVIPWSPKRELRAIVALYYGAVICLVGLVVIAPW